MLSIIILRSALISLVAMLVALPPTKADLGPEQIRKLITRMAGFELPRKAVRVISVSAETRDLLDARAEIETAFRLETNERGKWRVSEVRVAPGRWEQIGLLKEMFGAEVNTNDCDAPEFRLRHSAASEPGVKRARCLLAGLLGIRLPSDAVRIKQISPLSLPLASEPSALVLAVVQVEVRLTREARAGWRISHIRPGDRDWASVDLIITRVNEVKAKQARSDLESLARALAEFRKERGFYVPSDREPVLIDHLSPRYLARVIRIDPWQKPYQYKGERDHYTLRCTGPDGKENTADDIVLDGSAR